MRTARMFGMLVIGLLISGGAAGFEWPTEERGLVSTFGELRGGDFLLGIELAGEKEGVRPVLSGEVLFYSRQDRRRNTLPTGLGGMAVVQHERGIRSLYGYLREMKINSFNEAVDRDTLLGYTGGRGSTEVNGLYFQVIDGEFQRVVNPLLSLSSYPDTTPPRIEGLVAEKDGDARRIRSDGSLPKGDYEVSVETYDVSGALDVFHRMCPYTVRLVANGEEVASLEFDAVESRERQHVLVGGDKRPAGEVYAEPWRLSVGEVTFRPGEVQLEVTVSDFNGNEAVERYRVRVAE
jgi:hypothetical protein